MRSIAYALPPLPGFAGPKTYAAWPVWRDSTTDEVKFQPLPKKEAARALAQGAPNSTGRPTRLGSTAGRSAAPACRAVRAAVRLHRLRHGPPRAVLRRDCRQGGRMPPRRRRCAATAQGARPAALAAPLAAGTGRQRRLPAGAGDERLRRACRRRNGAATTSRRHAPPPEPGTWGDTLPCPMPITQAAEELRAQPGAHRTMFALLEADPGDQLAGALARFGRAIFGPQT